MSGPKHAEVRNWRAEIEAVRNEALARLEMFGKEIEELVKTGEIVVKVAREAGEVMDAGEMKSLRLWKKAAGEAEKWMANVKEWREEVTGRFTASESGLSRIQAIADRIPGRLPVADRLNSLRHACVMDRKESRRIRDRMRQEMKAAAEKLYRDNIESVREWVNDSAMLNELENMHERFAHATFEEMKDLSARFAGMMADARKKAQANKNVFEIKKSNSDHILSTLKEMGFEEIERQLETDTFGTIVVSGETPEGDWPVTFRIVSENEIRLDTPENDRCHAHLGNMVNNLREGGLHISIRELETRKERRPAASRMRSGKRERTRI